VEIQDSFMKFIEASSMTQMPHLEALLHALLNK